MLGSLRKFSSSIYAKILLGIVSLFLLFFGVWEVSFVGGSKNIIVVIEKEKYSTRRRVWKFYTKIC